MKKTILSAALSMILLLFLGTASLVSQEKFQAGGQFMLGFPQGEFKDNIEDTAPGGHFYFAFHFPRSPVSAGIAFGFLIYGSETRVEPLGATIPDVQVDVTTTNSILLCHVFLRLQPSRGRFRPYLDALIGLHYLTTDTSINNHDGWDEDHITSNNYNDLAFSYGLGGGAMVNLVQVRRRRSNRRLFSVDLDLGVRYLKGGQAEYLKKGSIHRQNGAAIYDVSRSRTDLLETFIGLSFSF